MDIIYPYALLMFGGVMMLDNNKRQWLLALKPEEITKALIDEKFSHRYDTATRKVLPPEISFQEEFTLKAGECFNKKEVKTNVGQLIVNKVLFGRNPKLQEIVGYVAEPFSKSTVGKIEDKMAKASNSGQLIVADWAQYLDCIQWLGNTANTNVAVSFTPNTTKVLPAVKKRRDELFKKHADAIKNNDVTVSLEISNELIKVAKEELKNDPGMTLYDSGAKPKFGNNYKNTFITRGPVFLPDKEGFEIG